MLAATEHELTVGSIQVPSIHLNGYDVGQPIMLGQSTFRA